MVKTLIDHGAIINHREQEEESSVEDIEYSNYVILKTEDSSMIENDATSS